MLPYATGMPCAILLKNNKEDKSSGIPLPLHFFALYNSSP